MPFSSIKGQDRQRELLTSALRRGTIAHAYLFSGISGIGKKTTALALAKALNCKVKHGDFCDQCTSCRKIDHSTHPDLHCIEPQGEYVKIDQIRSMQEQIKFVPYEGKYKVVIITHAEKMNLQSSNCLLKTLEEPPSHTLFILLTTSPYQMPSTVRSRCQRVMFQPLPTKLILEVLREKRGEKSDELEHCASLAGGSIGRALQWSEEGILKGRAQLLEKIFHLNVHHHVTDVVNLAETLGEDKARLVEFLDLLRIWLRDLLIFKETGKPASLINRDLSVEVSRTAHAVSYTRLFAMIEMINEVQSALRFNVNARLAAEVMLLKMCH